MKWQRFHKAIAAAIGAGAAAALMHFGLDLGPQIEITVTSAVAALITAIWPANAPA